MIEVRWGIPFHHCGICGTLLNDPLNPTSEDMEGDCLECVAVISRDPAVLKALKQLKASTSRQLV